MRLNDTTQDFFHLFKMKTSLSLDDYYEAHSNIFQTYFGGYCKKTNEKLSAAKERYVDDFNRMEEIRQVLPSIVEKVAAKGQSYFGFSIIIRAEDTL